MSKSTRTHTVDLTTAHSDGGVQLKIDHHVFEVTRLDDTASIRIGDKDARPTELGDTDRFVAEDGAPFDRVWIDNPASDVDGATLEITIPSGYCRERSASGRVRVVKSAGGASFDPTRLEGALAAATTITSGEEASEEVDVSGATAIRVRAKVSGTSAWDHRNTVTHADMVQPTAVAADPSGKRVWVACHDHVVPTTKVTEWDVSNPDAPTRTATLDDAELEVVEQLAYDADNDLLIAVTSASTPKLVVIDTSTPGTPSKSGSVTISNDDPVVLVLDTSISQAYVSGLFGGTTCSVDYSTPATPAEQDTTTDAVGPIALGKDGDVLHVHHRTGTASSRDDYKAIDVRDPSSIAVIDSVDMTDDITAKQGVAFDADRDLFFLLGRSGTSNYVAVFDVSNPFAAKLLAEPEGVVPDVVTDVTSIFYDDTTDRLYVQDGNDLAVVNLADEFNPVLVSRVNTTDFSNISGFNRAAHLGDFETWFVTNDGDGELNTLAWIPGGDQLRLWTKNPGGGRSSSLMPAALDLPDSEEAGVEFDVQGESTVEVEVAARSEEDTTVDYVDVYRATG